jgi:hypothetical protein
MVRQWLSVEEYAQWRELTVLYRDEDALAEMMKGQEPSQEDVELDLEDIELLAAAGKLQPCAAEEVKGTCRSFSVLEAAKHRRRWILHPATLNDRCMVSGEKMFPTVEKVINRARDFHYAVCFDFSWFFGQFGIEDNIGRFFALKKGSLYWIPTSIPTGARHPPLFCQLLCRAISRCVISICTIPGDAEVESDEYVDNIRFCSNDVDLLQKITDCFFVITDKLGITVNESRKDIHPVAQYTFLGINFNHTDAQVAISDKTRNRLGELIPWLKEPSSPRTWRELQQIFGVTLWACTVLRKHMATTSIYYVFKFMRRKASLRTPDDAIVKIWPSIINGWVEWLEGLVGSPPRDLRRMKDPQPLWMFTDASLLGWGAVVFCNDHYHIVAGSWPQGLRGAHINLLELKAVRLAFETVDCARDHIVQLRLDNTSAKAQLEKGRSPRFRYNGEIHRLRHLMERKNLVFGSTEYIRSDRNPADIWSRCGRRVRIQIHESTTDVAQRQTGGLEE